MVAKHAHLLNQSFDRELVSLRLDRLLQHTVVVDFLENKPREAEIFVHLITLSNFLFHHLCRCPESINLIGSPHSLLSDIDSATEVATLRELKYRELLRVTALDISGQVAYEQILLALTTLADRILGRVFGLVAGNERALCLLGMGKLGAQELNYSSDVDLIFVCANHESDIHGDLDAYYAEANRCIRHFSRHLEAIEPEGFLYRVDLRLRPWGKNAPLVMSVDDTEHYYEVSTEMWERFAWLRARYLAGSESLGMDILKRLRSYRYRGNLDLDDLQKFIDLKTEMELSRRQEGGWNVKLGEGGIRDIEFFIQVIQLANARRYPELQQTNTMRLIACMVKIGLLDKNHADEICRSYLFLRRLENRLQMIDEAQVHTLPEEKIKRLMIARSLGFANGDNDDDKTLERFNQYLTKRRDIAKVCFEMTLSKHREP